MLVRRAGAAIAVPFEVIARLLEIALPGTLGGALRQLLDLELVGLFFEDTSLRDLAGLPFARELRPISGGWHAIDVDRMSRDIESTARTIEKLFSDAARNTVTQHQFEIVRGSVAVTLPSISRSGDIVMIIEPTSAAERAGQQFAWLIEAAFRSKAAVMLVPPRIVRTSGPVLTIAAGSDDPSIGTAPAVAGAAKEELVIADVGETETRDTDISAGVASTGCAVWRVRMGQGARYDARALDHALSQVQERLVVLTRGVFDSGRCCDRFSAERASADRRAGHRLNHY